MSLLNTIISTIAEHPVVVTLAAGAGVRIISRDLGKASAFIKAHAASWDGVDRRGPNRAKNVVRPQFGDSNNPAQVLAKLKTPAERLEELRRTGTEG